MCLEPVQEVMNYLEEISDQNTDEDSYNRPEDSHSGQLIGRDIPEDESSKFEADQIQTLSAGQVYHFY